VKKHLLEYLELWLSVAGLAVILLVPAMLGGVGAWWKVAACTAVAVGLLHGVIFWVVRARQRQVRRSTLAAARAMLADGIHRQVAALLTMDATADPEQKRRLDGVFDSMILLDRLLDSLSDEHLHAWKAGEHAAVEMARPRPASRGAPDLHISRPSQN
jgi:hypothetical protein